MKWAIYYDRPTTSWWGYWMDKEGNQVGEAVFAHQKEECLVQLGMAFAERQALLQARDSNEG